MEVITKEYKTYKYDELSDEAKEKAFNKWYESQTEYFWIDDAIESMQAFAKHFDITVKDYSLQGSGYGHSSVSFEQYTFEEGITELKYVRLWKYLKNNDYEFVKWNKPESKYTHDPKKTTIFDDCPFTGYCADDDILFPMRDFIKRPYDITFYDLIDKCFDSWIKFCVADMDYQTSEECFNENHANEEIYLENGTVFYE